jgi:hypothetical protein
MVSRSAMIGASFALAALSSFACSSTPPPQPPDPISTPEPPPPPPKPRPKKCETLLDKCEGGEGKTARIPGSELKFQPAEGWFYSQEEAQTVMQMSDTGPGVALLVYETGDPKTEPNREPLVKKLVERLAITPPKEKINWKKPAVTKDVGSGPKIMKVLLWQLEGATRGDKKGPWLIFASQLVGGKSLLGMGFVPDDDSTSADALILKSIESIEAP